MNARIVNALFVAFWSCRGLLAEARHWMGRSLTTADDRADRGTAVELVVRRQRVGGNAGKPDEAAAEGGAVPRACRAIGRSRSRSRPRTTRAGYLALFSGDLAAAVEPFQTALASAGCGPSRATWRESRVRDRPTAGWPSRPGNREWTVWGTRRRPSPVTSRSSRSPPREGVLFPRVLVVGSRP